MAKFFDCFAPPGKEWSIFLGQAAPKAPASRRGRWFGKGRQGLDFEAQIERDNKMETRIILIALVGLAALVVGAVGIALYDVTPPDSAALTAPPPGDAPLIE